MPQRETTACVAGACGRPASSSRGAAWPNPNAALAALHAITQRFTAEWALRPFVQQHPELTFATLQRWARDDSAHVRRLVSEGTRPRLPWGMQLKSLIADPSPTLPLLRVLQDDASDYVRRSVANHLNDIAKDHPDLVVGWLREHLAASERRTPRAVAPRQPHADQAGPCADAEGVGPGPAAARQRGAQAVAQTRAGGRHARTQAHRHLATPRANRRC